MNNSAMKTIENIREHVATEAEAAAVAIAITITITTM